MSKKRCRHCGRGRRLKDGYCSKCRVDPRDTDYVQRKTKERLGIIKEVN